MAKYECELSGDFDRLLSIIEYNILEGSVSASYEDGSYIRVDDVRSAVRVYERYSFMGKNRVSMCVNLLGKGNSLFLTAITSGGSQAVFFKINTFGEESFLTCIKQIVKDYKNSRY